jgi:hypothetical protein
VQQHGAAAQQHVDRTGGGEAEEEVARAGGSVSV